jgi:hypothetical protein
MDAGRPVMEANMVEITISHAEHAVYAYDDILFLIPFLCEHDRGGDWISEINGREEIEGGTGLSDSQS